MTTATIQERIQQAKARYLRPMRYSAGDQERIPSGSPDGTGGQFAPKDGAASKVVSHAEKLKDHPPIPIPSVSGDEVTTATDPKQVRKDIEKWARKNLRGEYTNDHTRWNIRVSREGIDEAFTHGDDPDSPRALVKLPELIKNAVLVASGPHIPPERSIDRVHALYAPVNVAGKSRVVRITVKSYTDGGKKFYDAVSSQIVEPDVDLASGTLLSGSAPPSGSSMSIDRLLSQVKPEHRGDWKKEDPASTKPEPDKHSRSAMAAIRHQMRYVKPDERWITIGSHDGERDGCPR